MKNYLVLGWIVTWTASYQQQKGCDNQPPRDPYTGQSANYSYANYCSETITHKMERQFETKEQVQKFINDCPKETCTEVQVFQPSEEGR